MSDFEQLIKKLASEYTMLIEKMFSNFKEMQILDQENIEQWEKLEKLIRINFIASMEKLKEYKKYLEGKKINDL